jgi:hypothetical protein
MNAYALSVWRQDSQGHSKVLELSLLLLLIGSSAAFAQVDVTLVPKVGVDRVIGFEYESEYFNGSGPGTTAVVYSAEALYGLSPFLEVGAGLEHQRVNEGLGNCSLSLLPIYAAGRVCVGLDWLRVFAVGRIGRNFVFAGSHYYWDSKGLRGGFYWAGGCGLILGRVLLFEVAYSRHTYTHDVGWAKISMECRKVAYYFGINADL